MAKKAKEIKGKRKKTAAEIESGIEHEKQLENLIELLETGEIDYKLWMRHFPETYDRKVPTCKNCKDFRPGICKGGVPPIECFREKTRSDKEYDTEYVEELINELKEEDVDGRIFAVEALGNIGNTKAVEPLIEALKDEDGDVRLIAVGALEEIGDERAIEPFKAALKDKDSAVQMAASDAISEIEYLLPFTKNYGNKLE